MCEHDILLSMQYINVESTQENEYYFRIKKGSSQYGVVRMKCFITFKEIVCYH